MSLGGEDLRKTEDLPGAFPSEDAITKSELNNTTATTTTSGTAPGAGTQQQTKAYPEHDLGTHQNVAHVGGANNSGASGGGVTPTQNIAHNTTTTAPGGSTASPADSDPDHLLRRAGAEGIPASSSLKAAQTQHQRAADGNSSGVVQPQTQTSGSLASAANPLSGPAVADDDNDGFGAENAPDITEDLKAVGAGAATAVAAAAIAARDAALAAKDAAAPVVSAATEQAKQAAGYAAENAGPAASVASEQAKNGALYTKDTAAPAASAASEQARNAAVYTKDSAVPAASAASEQANNAAVYARDTAVTGATAAADTIQANAPTALGGGTTANMASPRDVAPEVPGQVKSSLAQAGEAPEAASSRRAVHDKGRVEGELLGYARELDAEDEARRQQQQQQQQHNQRLPQPPPPGVLPRLDSGPQTPSTGSAVVLGTDTERAFPLGSHPVSAGGAGVGGVSAAGQGGVYSQPGPVSTGGVEAGEDPQTSSGVGQDPQTSSGVGEQPPSARQRPPVEDKVPVRRNEEVAVPNGPDAYQKLSSGTPSGVGQ